MKVEKGGKGVGVADGVGRMGFVAVGSGGRKLGEEHEDRLLDRELGATGFMLALL